MIYYSYKEVKFGKILLLADEFNLLGLYYIRQKNLPNIDNFTEMPAHPIFEQTYTQINEYLEGERFDFTVSYQLKGTQFQEKVWSALNNIKYSSTVSYQDIANQINAPSSVRAVANAIGANPIMLIIPCHRIIGKDGSLTGYAGGIDLKLNFLNLEKKFIPVNL